MKETSKQIINNIIAGAITIGFWYAIYLIFGLFNIPLWIYKAIATSTFCMVLIFAIGMIMMIHNGELNDFKKQEPKKSKPKVTKVYGSKVKNK